MARETATKAPDTAVLEKATAASAPSVTAETPPAVSAVAAATGTQVAAFNYADEEATGFEGAGTSDFIVPMLDVLQAQSPEIVGSTIEGAKPGMLIVRALGEVFDINKDGFPFTAVGRQHVMNEWRPRESGGGLVHSHDPNDQDMIKLKKTQPFGKIKLQSGNEIVETYYLFIIHTRPDGSTIRLSVPFWSTKIGIYRAFMTKASGLTAERPGGGRSPMPMFAHLYKLTSFLKEKNSYKWWQYKDIAFNAKTALESRIDPTGELYAEARAFAAQIKAGTVRADVAAAAPSDDPEAGGAASGGGAATGAANATGEGGIPF